MHDVIASLYTGLFDAARRADVSAREMLRGARSRNWPNGDELSLYLLYSTVASPYSWKYYFVNLMFPLGAAVTRLWARAARLRGRTLGRLSV